MPSTVWKWLDKHSVIPGFFVTMLGVWAAFGLAGLSEQHALDSATKQRLHLVFLESQYNGGIAHQIIDDCANGYVRTDKPHTALAAAALGDANILAFLPHYKVSLLRSYVNAVATLNEALRVHESVLHAARYQPTPEAAGIRDSLGGKRPACLPWPSSFKSS